MSIKNRRADRGNDKRFSSESQAMELSQAAKVLALELGHQSQLKLKNLLSRTISL